MEALCVGGPLHGMVQDVGPAGALLVDNGVDTTSEWESGALRVTVEHRYLLYVCHQRAVPSGATYRLAFPSGRQQSPGAIDEALRRATGEHDRIRA